MPTDPNEFLAGFFNGMLDANQLEALERWVAEDPAHADALARYAIDQRAIEYMLRLERVIDLSDLSNNERLPSGTEPDEIELLAANASNDSSSMAFIIEQALADRRRHELEDEANRRLAAQQAEEARKRWLEQRHHNIAEPAQRIIVVPKPLVWLGLAAMIALLVSVVYVTVQSNPRNTSAPSPSAHIPGTPGPRQIQPVQVAHVTDTLDARWADGQAVKAGDPIFDRPYDLADGIIQIEFTSGVILTIEGPALVVPDSDMLVSLHHGQVVGLVPEQAHGFVVRTATVDVVDLGTEFAVEVLSEGRESLVQVLDGAVQLRSGRDAQPFTPVLAQAGTALTVGTDGSPEPTVVPPNTYYRQVPSAYERMIRDAGPLVYWRFNKPPENSVLAGLGASAASLRVGTRVDLRQDAPFAADASDRSLWMRAASQTLVSTQPIGMDTNEPFTVEAWVWVPADADRRMRIVSDNALKPDGRHASGFGFGVSADPIDRVHDSPVLMFTSYTVFDAYSQVPVPTESWTHVSASMDGRGKLRMTINGEQVPYQVTNDALQGQGSDELIVVPNGSPLKIGGALQSIDGYSEHWYGGIDEVAVYSRALSLDELATHASPRWTGGTQAQPPAR